MHDEYSWFARVILRLFLSLIRCCAYAQFTRFSNALAQSDASQQTNYWGFTVGMDIVQYNTENVHTCDRKRVLHSVARKVLYRFHVMLDECTKRMQSKEHIESTSTLGQCFEVLQSTFHVRDRRVDM
jgi:hypothetical protein